MHCSSRPFPQSRKYRECLPPRLILQVPKSLEFTNHGKLCSDYTSLSDYAFDEVTRDVQVPQISGHFRRFAPSSSLSTYSLGWISRRSTGVEKAEDGGGFCFFDSHVILAITHKWAMGLTSRAFGLTFHAPSHIQHHRSYR